MNPEKDLGKACTGSPAGPGGGALRHDGRRARVYRGEGRFTDARTVTVDGARVAGEKVIIAAGSTPVVPRLLGVEATITSDDLLFLPEVRVSVHGEHPDRSNVNSQIGMVNT